MNQIQVIPHAIIQGTGFDYASLNNPGLAADAQATARRIKDRLQTSYIDTGNDLLVIKDKLGHGRFGPWLETECIMSVRSAEECMSAARLATKYAITAYLPPTTLVALASPSADPGVRKQVLDDIEAGKPAPPPAKVKEMLAKARTAKKKAQAAQKKSPEQIAKEKAAQERADRAYQKKWDDIRAGEAEKKAREDEAVERVARMLVIGLGAARTVELFTLMAGIPFGRVESQFIIVRYADESKNEFLSAEAIEKKFGHRGVA
jgi:hypothetical protein